MTEYDMRKMVRESEVHAPKEIAEMVKNTLEQLPEKRENTVNFQSKNNIWKYVAVAAVAALFIIPNTSPQAAYAMGKLPVVGGLFRVITVRRFDYQNDIQEIDIKQPVVTDDSKSSAAGDMNQQIDNYTNRIMDKFYEDTDYGNNENHLAVQVDYDVITNTDSWFTLRLCVTEIAASSNMYYKYYHIDKSTDEIVTFSDLYGEDDAQKAQIKEDIIGQMEEQMKADDQNVYWISLVKEDISFDSEEEGWNFYFAENGELHIVFDKYLVGPGQMGCPDFAVKTDDNR